jgi:hypothetical protein
MTDTRADRLETLRRNLDRLTREAEDLADTIERDRRLAGEEAVGAELLATRDLVAHLGIAWETLEGLGDLYARQARLLAGDYADTWKALTREGVSRSVHEVIGAHLERRVDHVTAGVNEGIELLSSQSERACHVLIRLWAPFTAVVRQDWRRAV